MAIAPQRAGGARRLISAAFITHWRSVVPWAADHQVEHDLVISRALVELFSDARLAATLAFRGGTAIYKLLLASPLRFSDDIDLVQIAAGPRSWANRPSSAARSVTRPSIASSRKSHPSSHYV